MVAREFQMVEEKGERGQFNDNRRRTIYDQLETAEVYTVTSTTTTAATSIPLS